MKVLAVRILIVVLAAAAGCGGETTLRDGPAGRVPDDAAAGAPRASSTTIALFVFDVTTSFEQAAPSCVNDMLPVARWVAARRGSVYAGALMTGDPQTQPWEVEEHFNKPAPAAIRGNDRMERSHRMADAEKLKSRLLDIANSEPAHGGSPVLKMLHRTADFRRQRAARAMFIAVVCSDLAAFGDRLDVTKPIPQQRVDDVFNEWRGRFDDLAGADLYFVGVGRSDLEENVDPDSLTKVKELVRSLVEDAGARVRLMDTQLGDIFPLPR